MLLAGLVAVLSVLGGRAIAGSHTPTWPDGVVNVYDTSGMTDTVITAAHRWSVSGAAVRIRVVSDLRDADVVVRVDDRRLLELCGRDCIGYATSIGRPASGHAEVLLKSDLEGPPRPLSVWVAAHEFGHVLGLEHRAGRRCTLMSPRAFDTVCPPTLGSLRPTAEQLACVPAPADVDVAAGLYGGAAATRDPRCR